MFSLRLFLIGLVHTIFAVFVVALGVLICSLAWAESLRLSWNQILNIDPLHMTLIGGVIIAFGFILLWASLFLSRKAYYTIKVGRNRIDIHRGILLHYLRMYFNSLFPSHDCKLEVYLHQNEIEICVDMPSFDEEKQNSILEKIEKDISHTLASMIGYIPPFYLSVYCRAS